MKILLLSLFLIGAGSTSQIAVLSSLALAVLICLVLSAFYSGSETALVSVNKIRINQLVESENTRANIVHRLVESPQRMLALTLVGTNLANVLIAQLGAGLVARGLPNLAVSLQGTHCNGWYNHLTPYLWRNFTENYLSCQGRCFGAPLCLSFTPF